MNELPPVRYVTTGDESIAYRDHGGAGPAIVYLGTFGSNQDLMWEEPGYAHLLRSLASMGRLITFDRRGAGLSSRTVRPTIEVRVEDVDRVLDATGVDRAVLVAAAGSTETALAYGAMRPSRVRALALYAAVARMSRAPGYDIGVPEAVTRMSIETTESVWGTGITTPLYAPSLADDPQFLAWSARMERSVATPVEARQWVEMYHESDVRDVLPLVRAPVLVVTPTGAGQIAGDLSRFVADHLGDVRAVEISARDQWPYGDGMEPFLEAISTLLDELADELVTPSTNRRLAAVLFTDLVASTEQLRSVGDRRWSTVLDSHDDAARRVTARHGGTVVKSTGDGVLAVFDGPAAAVLAAAEILRSVHRIGLSARAGVHIGEIEVRGDDITGIAVTLGSRIADRATADEILVSGTVRDLVSGSGLRFEPRGAPRLKGIDEPVELLAVRIGELPPLTEPTDRTR